MNIKNYFLILLFIIICPANSFPQGLFQKPLETKVKYTESVIDPDYGIMMYTRLTIMLGGDSVRYCNGYACQSWIEDHYENGQLLHKGYYMEGQLKIYKNYYPDGAIERQFRNTDLSKCELITHYPDGKLRTKGVYINGSALQYEEYYANGSPGYYEESHKSLDYYINTRSYFENGKPESILQLIDPKKMIYNKMEYYENGNIKEEGKLFFNKSSLDYYKADKWLFYNENGKLVNESFYENGKKIKENNY